MTQITEIGKLDLAIFKNFHEKTNLKMASVTPAALESCSLTFFKFIFSKRVFRNEFLQLVTMSW